MKILEIFALLLAGALAVSTAEYKFNYNLIDLIVEKLKKL